MKPEWMTLMSLRAAQDELDLMRIERNFWRNTAVVWFVCAGSLLALNLLT